MTTFERIIAQFLDKRHARTQEPSAQDIPSGYEEGLRARLKAAADLLSAEKIASIKARINAPLTIAVSGQFSSGKSTLLNALLGQEILPSGITPVTSKINYIVFDKTPFLEVVQNSGRALALPLEALKDFTDQRRAQNSAAHLVVHYPSAVLEKITFIDTPGFNSNSDADTALAKEALAKADGIIWLSLIDAAGKKSEQDALRLMLKNYADKSLCVLNQKDKLAKEQVQSVCNYVRQSFGGYFKDVIAVSAKQALQGALSGAEELKQGSNIGAVLDFLEREFTHYYKVRAADLKLTAALEGAAVDLKKRRSFYDELALEFNEFCLDLAGANTSAKAGSSGGESASADAPNALEIIEAMVEKIAAQTYKNIKPETRSRLVSSGGLLRQCKTQEYDFYRIDKEIIKTSLFEGDEPIKRMFLRFRGALDDASTVAKTRAQELTQRAKSFCRAGEYAEQTQFLQEFYKEHVLKIQDAISASAAKQGADLSAVSATLKGSYALATKSMLARLENARQDALFAYEQNPAQFPFATPTLKEITQILEEEINLEFYKKALGAGKTAAQHGLDPSLKLEAVRAIDEKAQMLSAQLVRIENFLQQKF
ncbi:MAG: dynamin family protein [Helicobacteraceae bacterium]